MIGVRTDEENLPPITTVPVTNLYQNLSLTPSKSESEETNSHMLRISENEKESIECEKSLLPISARSSFSSVSTSATRLSVTYPDILEISC